MHEESWETLNTIEPRIEPRLLSVQVPF